MQHTMIRSLVLSVSLATFAIAQTETFVCHPCFHGDCYLSNTNTQVNLEFFGQTTCGEIQSNIDNPDFVYVPDTCSYVQQVTLAGDNPCGCKKLDGSACPAVPTLQNKPCNVCEYDGYIVGDPDRVTDYSNLNCAALDEYGTLGAFTGDNCNIAKTAAREYCQCYYPYASDSQEPPEQCVKQNDDCNPLYDNCCELLASCVWQGKFRCSTNPALPTKNPIPIPTRLPTQPPQISPAPIDSVGGNAPPLDNCALEGASCDVLPCCGDAICKNDPRLRANSQPIGYVCKPPSGNGKDCLSLKSDGQGGEAGNQKDC